MMWDKIDSIIFKDVPLTLLIGLCLLAMLFWCPYYTYNNPYTPAQPTPKTICYKGVEYVSYEGGLAAAVTLENKPIACEGE